MDGETRLIEESDRWIVAVGGRLVSRCLIDYAFSLELGVPEELVTIRIEGSFQVTTKGQPHRLSAEEPAIGIKEQRDGTDQNPPKWAIDPG